MGSCRIPIFGTLCRKEVVLINEFRLVVAYPGSRLFSDLLHMAFGVDEVVRLAFLSRS